MEICQRLLTGETVNNAQFINQTSGAVEHYTPAHIMHAVHKCMGRIDLDPASCVQANKTVKAWQIYIKEENGLSFPWKGKIWLNHPFGRETNKIWIAKLMHEYEDVPHIEEALCITYACTSEKWFQPLFNYPMCFLSPRTNYLGTDGKPVKGVTKGSVVTYLGDNVTNFVNAFMDLGRIKI